MYDAPTATPLQLNILGIDLAIVLDDTAAEFIVMRLFDATGLTLDAPMPRAQAEQFGRSLSNYASIDVPEWLAPTTVSPAKAAARMPR
ncbi:hypothetical protein BH09ACT8_BH09ACT8_61510 [soil metagenome]